MMALEKAPSTLISCTVQGNEASSLILCQWHLFFSFTSILLLASMCQSHLLVWCTLAFLVVMGCPVLHYICQIIGRVVHLENEVLSLP